MHLQPNFGRIHLRKTAFCRLYLIKVTYQSFKVLYGCFKINHLIVSSVGHGIYKLFVFPSIFSVVSENFQS